jgi:hypothetical protein
MLPEESVPWKKVFTELWSEKVTKENIAADLGIPADGIENLVFGLLGTPQRPTRGDRRRGLHAV